LGFAWNLEFVICNFLSNRTRLKKELFMEQP
jgi:hypothetical protein